MVRLTPTFALWEPQSIPKEPTEFPDRTDSPIPSQDWQVTQHVYPAAYPRSRIDCTTPSKTAKTYSLDSKRDAAEVVQQRMFELDKAQEESDYDDGPTPKSQQLWVAVNRYTPRKPSKKPGLTLLFAHANGMHKETWEPTIGHLLKNLKKLGTVDVAEIWSFDVINQGQSAVFNVDHLGVAFDWIDVGRDFANFILRYLPPASTTSIPTLLPSRPIPDPELLHLTPSKATKDRAYASWRDRSIVCIGHSIGGAAMTSAISFLPPHMVRALILVDPVLTPPNELKSSAIYNLVQGALTRKEAWKDRETALEGWKKNKGFYGRWEAGVLSRYAEFALKDTKEGLVALKMEREQEAVTFMDPNLQGARNAWQKLGNLPAPLKLAFFLADPEQSVIFGRGITQKSLEQQCAYLKPSIKIMKGVGHMIAQEKPDDLGLELANKLTEWFGSSRAKL